MPSLSKNLHRTISRFKSPSLIFQEHGIIRCKGPEAEASHQILAGSLEQHLLAFPNDSAHSREGSV